MFPMIYRAYSVITRPFNQSNKPLIDEPHHSTNIRQTNEQSNDQTVDHSIKDQTINQSNKQSKKQSDKHSVAEDDHKQSIMNQTNNQSMNQSNNQSSIIDHEVSKFTAMAEAGEWWNETGEANLLHKMNPIRVGFLKQNVQQLLEVLYKSSVSNMMDSRNIFAGIKMLDVGCGGGLLCEPLARLGGDVTGIDASAANIEIARAHADLDPAIKDTLKYRHITAEDLQAEGAQFDVVCCSEVIEHVAAPEQFTQTLCNLVKPGGVLMMSTMNRTGLSYVVAILAAEYVLRLVPTGTHEWSKFVTPNELKQWINDSKVLTVDSSKEVHVSDKKVGMKVHAISGMVFDPIKDRWTLEKDRLEVNYILCAKRPS